jgi:hypothetical protein
MSKTYRFGFVIDGSADSGTKTLKRFKEEVSSLERETGNTRRRTREWREETEKTNKSLLNTKNVLSGVAGVLASMGVYQLVDGFKNTIVETERLRGSLLTVTGSADLASDAFSRLTEFAAETPFTLDQSVNAFIRLKSLGLDPSERALASYGNTASAMGKDMMQMIEAVADASTFEFERLKEFGIRAQQQGDQVSLTFQGVTTVVEKESAAIEEYLMRIGENQFASAMEDQMDRLPGLLSNLEDAVDGLYRKIGDDGATTTFGKGINLATDAVEYLTENTDVLYTAIETLTVLITGRVVGALAASTAETIKKRGAEYALIIAEREKTAATLASTQADLAAAKAAAARTPGFYLNAQAATAMANAEKAATVATNAHAAAMARTVTKAGLLRGAMGLLGGGTGVFLIAAYGAWQLVDALWGADEAAEEVTDSVSELNDEIEKLGSAYSQQLQTEIAATSLMLNQAVAVYGANSSQVQQLLRDLEDLRGEYNALTSSTGNATAAAGEMSEKAADVIAKLQEEIELIGLSDRQREIQIALREAEVTALSETGKEIARLAGLRFDETKSAEDQASAAKKSADELKRMQDRLDALILSEKQQQSALAMVGRQREIYNALVRAGLDLSPEDQAAIAREVGLRYDQEEAIRRSNEATEDATRAAEDFREEQERLNKQLQEDWAETRREFGEFWADMVQDGENAFDALLNSFERMLLEMTGQLALSGLASMFGIKTPGGAAGGIQGVLDSSGFAGDALGMLLKSDAFKQITNSTGLSDIFGSFGGGGSSMPGANAGADAWSDFYASGGQSSGFNADAFVSGLKTAGLTIGAGAVGAYAGNALGEGIFSKEAESNIAASVGTAIGSFVGGPLGALVGSTLGSLVDVATGGDGKVRYNAGMLVGPTPSAAGSDRAFEVDPFESGLQVMGAARRVDRSVATDVINTFREVDSVVSKLVRELNGNLDLTKASLGGLDEEATPGSSGTFLGLGGNGALAGDLEAQVDYYVSQVIDHVSGLSDELYASVKAAGTAEEAITILSEALVRQEAESDKAAQAAQEASTAMDKVRQAEERLLTERLGIIGTLTDELENAIALQGSVRMSIYEAMGASPLHEIGVTVSGQIAQIEEQRRLIISAHEEEMRAEQRLHEQRLRSAQSLADAATDIRLGDMSNLNSPLKLDFAQENFRDLAAAAANGDMDAISRIQQAADQYISAADDMYASGAGRQEVVSEVLGVLDSLSVSLGQSTYDPAAANQSLINQLSALDSQLADISAGINDDIISQLENINVTLDELTPNLRDTLTGAIAQWVSSSNPGGNAIIDSLGGIKGSVDALPPEIAGYMSSAMGSWINSMLSNGAYSQVVADSISRGGLDESAANQYLGSQGMGSVGDYRSAYNPDVGAQDIVSQIGAITAQSATEEEAIRAAYEAAIANGVGSKQIADAMGVSQTSILDAVTGLGLPAFAKGGNHSGGWRWVGEQGPELEYTGPSRIFSHQDSMRMMQPAANDGAMVREIQSLNSEVIRLRETVAMIGDDAASQRDRQTRIESEMADELKRGNGRKSVGNIG